MAILFVTVLVVEAETAVEANTFPVEVGSVSVVLPDAVPALSVTEPPPVPLIATGIRLRSKLNQTQLLQSRHC